ncbi:MAG: type IX secretion system membrane protein PorP/SprF [Elusimicrobia bacterium]|nr:type IX secretion system membrane protein PorP/SprF [Candidatus Obscuribacterium magneticum]
MARESGVEHRYVSQSNGLKSLCLFGAMLLFWPGLSRAAFQENLWGARPASLAGAFTALADDANAPVYNPAGISLTTNNEITLMYARLYSGLKLYAGDNDTSRLGLGFFSYVPQIAEKRFGSYGFSWTNFTATNLYREDTFSLTVADSYQFDQLSVRPILSYGANVKLLRRSFSTDVRTDQDAVFQNGRDSTAFTFDVGLIAQPRFSLLPGLKIGMAAQNVTEPDIGLASTDRVPARYSFGLAYEDRRFRYFNPAIDVSRRRGRTLVSAAWEGWVAGDTLALRLGGNADQLAGGIGYRFRLSRQVTVGLDYSIQWPFNVEGTDGTHRVSITTNF